MGTVSSAMPETTTTRQGKGAARAARPRAEERLRELAERNELLASVIETMASGIMIVDHCSPERPIIYSNPAFQAMTGYSAGEIEGRNPRFLRGPDTDPVTLDAMRDALCEERPISVEILNYRHDGTSFWNQVTLFPVLGTDGIARFWVATCYDVTAQRAAEAETKRLQRELLQTSRLEALGTLAGGIAHEINTPMQYVGDNLDFLAASMDDLLRLAAAVEPVTDALDAGRDWTAARAALAEIQAGLDLAFALQEVPTAIHQTRDGIGRVRQIVQAIKAFSHPDTEAHTPHDLAAAISTTVTISRNQWKYAARMETDIEAGLPLVPCNIGEINQVLLNLIVNAAHAIEDRDPSGGGTIRISARQADGWAEIRISDTGIGIAPENHARVWDLFFTTKAPGRGTGQGLAICHSIVTRNHRGSIDFESERGVGTTFTVRLPLVPEDAMPVKTETAA